MPKAQSSPEPIPCCRWLALAWPQGVIAVIALQLEVAHGKLRLGQVKVAALTGH